jgi:hypothetical protein
MTPPAGRDDGDAGANRDGRITRDVVLAAALELIDRDGADGLSVRRLGRALGRDPMILYRHAPNSKNSSRTPTRPTTCYGWACTGCRSANSPCYAASPPP